MKAKAIDFYRNFDFTLLGDVPALPGLAGEQNKQNPFFIDEIRDTLHVPEDEWDAVFNCGMIIP